MPAALPFLFPLLVLLLAVAPAAEAVDAAPVARTCAGCHGTDGASPGRTIPVVGGQGKGYLRTALDGFADGSRPGSVMAPLARGLSAEERGALSAWFSARPWVNTRFGKPPVGEVPRGECDGCHGASGKGSGSAPRIAGQPPEYLAEALAEYRDGARKSPAMAVARKVDGKRARELAAFYASAGKRGGGAP